MAKKKNKKKKEAQRPALPRYFYEPVDWDSVDDLGETYDSVIASRLGVSPQSVCKARKVRGIPCFDPRRKIKMRKRKS